MEPMNDDPLRSVSAEADLGPQGRPGARAVRQRAVAVMAGLLAGVAFGAVTSMANVFGSAYGPFTAVLGEGVAWLQFVSLLLDALWAWALFPFAVGWFVRRPVASVLAGAGGMLAAVVAYYVSDAALGMTAGVEVDAIRVWAPIALVGAPVMALLGSLARGRSFASLVAGLVAPVMMIYVVVEAPARAAEVGMWADRTVLVLAVVVAGGLLARYARSRTLAQS
jgi:hypothetical protein